MGFEDDIAIVSVAKTVREIEEKTNTAIRNVRAWLDEAGLTLAAHKTEDLDKDSGEDGSDRWGVKDRIEEGDKIFGSNYRRQVKLQGAREVHR